MAIMLVVVADLLLLFAAVVPADAPVVDTDTTTNTHTKNNTRA